MNLFSTDVKDFFARSSETEIKGILVNSILTLDLFFEKDYNNQVKYIISVRTKKINNICRNLPQIFLESFLKNSDTE